MQIDGPFPMAVRGRYWTFDPEQQEFIRDSWDLMVKELIAELYGPAEDA